MSSNLFFDAKDYCRDACDTGKLKDNIIHTLNIHLSYHCNLNCAGCSFFAPIAPDKLPETDTIISDLKQLSILTKDNPIECICLLGGEPLLNKDVVSFCYIVRELFPKSTICLATNGLLLPKQSKKFWKAILENNIFIIVAKYFKDSALYDKIWNTAKKYSCENNIDYSLRSKDPFGPMFIYNRLSHKDTGDYKDNWEECPLKNNAISLRNGKLYSCQYIALLDILNDYFKEDFKIFEDDGIDIYKNSYEEIIFKLSKPKLSCQYCDKDCFNCLYFISESKKEKYEWIR